MKGATLFVLTGTALVAGQERGLPERFIYEKPLCESIAMCSQNPGCDGKKLTARKGTISLSDYPAYFGCRWEIKAAAGNKIKIKVEQSPNSFGIENQASCGYDRLHIRSGDDEAYGRLCSTKKDSNAVYNGMSKFETHGGVKIPSYKFRDWLLLDTNDLVVAFDSDQRTNGKGFTLFYEIAGDNVHSQGTLENVGDKFESNLHSFIMNITDKAPHQQRLVQRLEKLFAKFDYRMKRCKNGDQSQNLHTHIEDVVFDSNNLKKVKTEWLGFFREAFNKCDLYIIRKYGSFDKTNWPVRISSWFRQLARDLPNGGGL